ncbi:hypothetical protein WJN01_00860 [Flavobacteriaceae bacterium SZ-1-7]|uniref:hypothetical protein n=1 Tax=Tamlana sedimenti TaxID=3134126 RepID=UPI00312205B5
MKKLTALIIGILIVTSCSEKRVNQEDIMNQVLTTYNEMYYSYGEGTDEFFKYFEDDFLRLTPSGKLQKGVEDRKIEWNNYLKMFSLGLESFDEPEMIISKNQVITIGGYNEYFVNRKTKDTSHNRGIYVATWRKQENGIWKICMDTWHAGLDKQ